MNISNQLVSAALARKEGMTLTWKLDKEGEQ